MPELSPEENAALRRACSAIRDGADVPDHFKDFLKELGVTSFPKPSSNGSAKPPPASDPEPAPMDDDSDFEDDPDPEVVKRSPTRPLPWAPTSPPNSPNPSSTR